MADKRMIIAMVLSVIFAGLGLIYLKDMKRGILLFVMALIFDILYFKFFQICGLVVFIVWLYSLYATYQEVKAQ